MTVTNSGQRKRNQVISRYFSSVRSIYEQIQILGVIVYANIHHKLISWITMVLNLQHAFKNFLHEDYLFDFWTFRYLNKRKVNGRGPLRLGSRGKRLGWGWGEIPILVPNNRKYMCIYSQKRENQKRHHLGICDNDSKCTESIIQKFLIHILQRTSRVNFKIETSDTTTVHESFTPTKVLIQYNFPIKINKNKELNYLQDQGFQQKGLLQHPSSFYLEMPGTNKKGEKDHTNTYFIRIYGRSKQI